MRCAVGNVHHVHPLEYPRAQRVVRERSREARAGHVLGREVVEVISGAGSYVCGERPHSCARSRACVASQAPHTPPSAACGASRPWCRTSRRSRSCRGPRHSPAGSKAVCLAGALHAGRGRIRSACRCGACWSRRAADLPGRGWRISADRRPDGLRGAGAPLRHAAFSRRCPASATAASWCRRA